jgi:hypothetical protein
VYVEDTYPDEFSKIALALTSAQLAKQDFVGESGVGEDLAFNFVGWKDGKILTISQLGKAHMKEPPVERLQRCAGMLRMLKGFWNVDSISMVAEGYCSPDIEKTRGLDLQKAYLDDSTGVSECITVTHAEPDDLGDVEVTLVSVSYEYRSGNKIDFKPIIVYPNGAVNTLRDKSYPALLYKTVREDYVVNEESEDEAAETVNNLGFHLQVFY